MGAAVQRTDQGIYELLVLETAAPARGRDLIGHPAHVLHPARQNDFGHASLNHGHARKYGLHSGDAYPVNGDGGDRVGKSCQKRPHTGHVERVGRFDAAPEARSSSISAGSMPARATAAFMVILANVAACVFFRLPPIRTDGRSTGGNDNDILHVLNSFLFSSCRS